MEKKNINKNKSYSIPLERSLDDLDNYIIDDETNKITKIIKKTSNKKNQSFSISIQTDSDNSYLNNDENNEYISDDFTIKNLISSKTSKNSSYDDKNKKHHFSSRYGKNKHNTENIKLTNETLTEEIAEVILNCLKKHFIFANMEDYQRKLMLQNMFSCEVEEGKFIFRQGDEASYFFIIVQGSMEVIVDGNKKKYLVRGDGFGELALLYNVPRTASLQCFIKASLWSIDSITFWSAIEELIMKDFESNRRFLECVLFLDTFSEDQKRDLTNAVIIQKYSNDEIIVDEGDQSNCFYIIKEGLVQAFKGETFVRSMKSGELFGESALLTNIPRQMTVRASSDVILLALAKDKLKEILKDQVNVIAYKNIQKWAILKSKYLKMLSTSQRDRLIEKMKIKIYSNNTEIIKIKQPINKLIILLNGIIIINNQKFDEVGRLFFDENLIKEKVINEESYIAFGKVSVSEITFDDFTKEMGGNLEELLKHKEKPHEQKILIYKNQKRNQKPISLELKELIHVRKIGQGNFSGVFLVSSLKGNDYYALKVLSKEDIVERDFTKNCREEKYIHEQVTFPFIVNYYRTYKDDYNIYFLMEYINGTTLSDLLKDRSYNRNIKIILYLVKLSAYESKFYIGAMILAIEYLHHHNIVHRDLKPENIMIDKSGYPKLLDLGLGKILTPNQQANNRLRTYSMIGTPHYSAPEILKYKGYNLAVDYWSLGVCLYEFMCGSLPFGNDISDPLEVCEEILKKDVKYPQSIRDISARRLMNQLLSKNPDVRLGGSFMNLKLDPWFYNFDWDLLLEKEMQPPLIPKNIEDVYKTIDNLIKKYNVSISKFLDDERKNNNYKTKSKKKITKLPMSNWDEIF